MDNATWYVYIEQQRRDARAAVPSSGRTTRVAKIVFRAKGTALLNKSTILSETGISPDAVVASARLAGAGLANAGKAGASSPVCHCGRLLNKSIG
jgi:hypothetical protein